MSSVGRTKHMLGGGRSKEAQGHSESQKPSPRGVREGLRIASGQTEEIATSTHGNRFYPGEGMRTVTKESGSEVVDRMEPASLHVSSRNHRDDGGNDESRDRNEVSRDNGRDRDIERYDDAESNTGVEEKGNLQCEGPKSVLKSSSFRRTPITHKELTAVAKGHVRSPRIFVCVWKGCENAQGTLL